MRKLILSVLLTAYGSYAFAYLDPNLGGWLYQFMFPVLIAIVAFWRYLKQTVATFVQKLLQLARRDSQRSRKQ